jgi:hypothetical protein
MAEERPNLEGFVADRQDRIRKSPAYQAAAEAARREVFKKFNPAINRATGRRQDLLIRARERALARRLEALAPSDALYLYMP